MMLGDKQMISLPIGGEGMNTFYNSTLLDAAGQAYPDDSFTWDAHLAMAKALTKTEGDKTTQFGTSLATLMAWWAWPMLLWDKGVEFVDSHY